MKTAILTDTNSGIFPEEGEKLGVAVIPMPVILDGVQYFEGVDLTHQHFFERLLQGADASTSQPLPGDVLGQFDRLLASGYDQVVYIPMSSGLSSSCETAKLLAQDYVGKVWVADDHRVSVTLHDAVLGAKAMADQGADAPQIVAALEAATPDSVIYLGVDTLKYFKKNGRCTAAAALLSSALNLKPLLRCDGQRFDAYAKVRGAAACRVKLLEAMKEAADQLRRPGEKLSIGAASTFVDPAEEQGWVEQTRAAFPDDNFHYEPLSFSVACHTGPNAFGMGLSRGI